MILAVPNYTALRLSGSMVRDLGGAFFRSDLGLDLAIDKPRGGNGVFLRANVALGAHAGKVDLTAELVNLGSLDGDGDVENRFVHSLAFGLRTRGANQFHVGTVFPLDEGARGELWIVSLGFQRAM